MAPRPRQRLSTVLKKSAGSTGLTEDRRRHAWAISPFFMVRTELLAHPPTDPVPVAKVKKLLRSTLDAPSHKLRPINLGRPAVLIDQGRPDPLRLRALTIVDGPAGGAAVYLPADRTDMIHEAAREAFSGYFDWWATGGPRAAVVLRREGDRMAVAITATVAVEGPWRLELVDE